MEDIAQILRDIQRRNRVYREKQLEQLGLTTRHGLYLKEISETPGISQEQLAQRLYVNKSNVARQAAAMEEEGYIERRPCGKDKRVLRLYLTEKALSVLPRVNEITAAWEDLLVQDLTESEQQILEILLLRLHSNALAAVKEGDA